MCEICIYVIVKFFGVSLSRIYPDYYDEIKKPLSLLNVQKKLKVRMQSTEKGKKGYLTI